MKASRSKHAGTTSDEVSEEGQPTSRRVLLAGGAVGLATAAAVLARPQLAEAAEPALLLDTANKGGTSTTSITASGATNPTFEIITTGSALGLYANDGASGTNSPVEAAVLNDNNEQ